MTPDGGREGLPLAEQMAPLFLKEERKREDVLQRCEQLLFSLYYMCGAGGAVVEEEGVMRGKVDKKNGAALLDIYLAATLGHMWVKNREKLRILQHTYRADIIVFESQERDALRSTFTTESSTFPPPPRPTTPPPIICTVEAADWRTLPTQPEETQCVQDLLPDLYREMGLIDEEEEEIYPIEKPPEKPGEGEGEEGDEDLEPIGSTKLHTRCPFKYASHCVFYGSHQYDEVRLKQVHFKGRTENPPSSSCQQYAELSRPSRLHRLLRRFRQGKPLYRLHSEFKQYVEYSVLHAVCASLGYPSPPPPPPDPLPEVVQEKPQFFYDTQKGIETAEGPPKTVLLTFDVSEAVVSRYAAGLKMGVVVRFGNQCKAESLRNQRAVVVGEAMGMLWVLPWRVAGHAVGSAPRPQDVASAAVPVRLETKKTVVPPEDVPEVFDVWRTETKTFVKNCAQQEDHCVYPEKAVRGGGGGGGGGGCAVRRAKKAVDPIVGLDSEVAAEVGAAERRAGITPRPPKVAEECTFLRRPPKSEWEARGDIYNGLSRK